MRGGKASYLGSLALLLLAGCATAPLEQTGALSSYRGLASSNGILTHARISLNKEEVLAAGTIAIMPTTFSEAAFTAGLSDTQRAMVANVVDRSMCIGLGDRFHIVGSGEPHDLTVHAVITYVHLTDANAAALSRAASIGASVAEAAFLTTPMPIPMPRIPVGLGALSVEAEARDGAGDQRAAMIWARGADVFTTKPKVSTASDPYDLAKSFGADFSQFLVTGSSPFKSLPKPPSVSNLASTLGAPPKEAICDAFGRGPGVAGVIGDLVGLPPEWTDKGAPVGASASALSSGGPDPTAKGPTY